MSPLAYKTIRHTGLSLSAAVLMAMLEIGLGGLLCPPVQAVSLPLLTVAVVANFLIAASMSTA